jgi:hypothetical protein
MKWGPEMTSTAEWNQTGEYVSKYKAVEIIKALETRLSECEERTRDELNAAWEKLLGDVKADNLRLMSALSDSEAARVKMGEALEKAWKHAALSCMVLELIVSRKQKPNPEAFDYPSQLKSWEIITETLRSALPPPSTGGK